MIWKLPYLSDTWWTEVGTAGLERYKFKENYVNATRNTHKPLIEHTGKGKSRYLLIGKVRMMGDSFDALNWDDMGSYFE